MLCVGFNTSYIILQSSDSPAKQDVIMCKIIFSILLVHVYTYKLINFSPTRFFTKLDTYSEL